MHAEQCSLTCGTTSGDHRRRRRVCKKPNALAGDVVKLRGDHVRWRFLDGLPETVLNLLSGPQHSQLLLLHLQS